MSIPIFIAIALHQKLDDVNAQYGTPEALCVFCKATEFDGAEGIIHNYGCWVIYLRRIVDRIGG